jgi:two-component system phosphate regulon sensor histidine kinase PhoR
MKDLTPKGIALRISAIVAGLVTLIVFGLDYLLSTVNYVLLVAVFLLSFLTSYVAFIITVERFIYKKIKLIYRTIHRLKLDKSDTANRKKVRTDVLNQVQSDVEAWDKTNKAEIERLNELETYRRDFVGNVSHELKTPIFNIQGYVLTLLEGGLEDPTINESYLKKAALSIDRMISLVENLDEISKLESGIIAMNMEKIDLSALIKEVLSFLELKAKSSNITLKFVGDLNRAVWVSADYGGINQVLVNLIVNSIKYGKEGGETLIRLHDMHDNILVEVADNGKGIGEKHLPRLFERFYRTDKGRGRASGGSGLGLSIVKHIIEGHHQTINVRSSIDVGSTFSFTLKKV